jgi:ApbE superfamily uncharacterized protein (UPF0280 family)
VYEPRVYRHWVKDNELVSFNVVVKETDLYIRASSNLEQEALKLVMKYRNLLERYIEQHPSFLTSLEPVAVADNAPAIVSEMAEAARKAGVGPMAAVAGAIAEFVGRELLALSPEVIIENGGDIYLKSLKERRIGIYAGKSPLSGKIALEISGEETPMGICTSSGTVGHSLSFGKADAAMVLSKSATLADAAATAIGNIIVQPSDIPLGIELAQSIDGITGVIIIKDDKMGLWGEVKLCPTSI